MSKISPTILIIQPTSLCNLNCKYCYISETERKNADIISMKTIEKTVKLVLKNLTDGDCLNINWHAGEPLTVGIKFYETAISLINKLNTNNIKILHNIQTNGILINNNWITFFKKYNIYVGLSIDGPEILHDQNRVNWKKNSSFQSTIKAINLLKNNNIKFSALTVISKKTLDLPEEFFLFFLKQKINSIGYNIEINYGNNSDNWKFSESDRTKIKNFWDKTIKLWAKHKDEIRIREIEDQIHLIQEKQSNSTFQFIAEENQTLKIVLVDKYGSLFTYSPTLAFEEIIEKNEKKFQIGNVHDINSLDDLLNTEKLKELKHQIQKGINLCLSECIYFDLCGGGCPGSKLAENKTFESTTTKWCEFKKIILTDVILENRDLIDLDNYRIYRNMKSTLKEGIKIFFSNQISTENRLHLSSGVESYSGKSFQGIPYKNYSFVPKKPWKKCNIADEKKLLANSEKILNIYDAIGVVKIPDYIIMQINTLKLDQLSNTSELNQVKQSKEYKIFIENLLNYLNEFSKSKESLTCLDICMNIPGMPTTSIDLKSQKLVGLHLDNWDKKVLNDTESARNRICINIGKEERYFSFCNLPIKQIIKELETRSNNIKDGVHLASTWFQEKDSYPIVRLKVLPGEAYISPTENLLHDGITDLKKHLDLHLTVLGYFDPKLCETV